MENFVFTANNIFLDNGVLTKPEALITINEEQWFTSAKRVLIVRPAWAHSWRCKS